MKICVPCLHSCEEADPYFGTVGTRDKNAIDQISILSETKDAEAGDASYD